jgi:hypothetical protein
MGTAGNQSERRQYDRNKLLQYAHSFIPYSPDEAAIFRALIQILV